MIKHNVLYHFIERYWLLLVLVVVVLTRLPFLWTGYGADEDAWLVANSASTLWNTGTYLESRLPGYPLHEIISAPFVHLGGGAVKCSNIDRNDNFDHCVEHHREQNRSK